MNSSLHRFRISKSSSSSPNPRRESRTSTRVDRESRPLSVNSSTSSTLLESPENNQRESRPVSQSACERCRRMKRKCSKTPTVLSCTLCLNGGFECSFEHPSVPPPSRIQQLEARVAWLSELVNENLLKGSSSIQSLDTGANIAAEVDIPTAPTSEGMLPASHEQAALQQLSSTNLAVERSSEAQSNFSASPLRQSLVIHSDHGRGLGDPSGRTDALQFAEAYFRHIHRSYPFIDQSNVIAVIKTMGTFQPSTVDKLPTKLYILTAIGCTTLQRIGQVTDDAIKRFKISPPDILRQCLLAEDIESVETCLLLGLYSLFEPSTSWPWKVVGILARQVTRLGLSRQAFAHGNLTIRQVEMRHRLFWSVWTLDRMVSTTLGLPFGINDDNINVPLPGITLEEYSAPESAQFSLSLQINQHVITLRQLEEQILQRIHFTSSNTTVSLSATDKRIVVQDLRTKIEDWYTLGCLVTPQERDNVPFHNTIPWLNVRYQNLLLLLYTPSHFNSSISNSHLGELRNCTQQYIKLSAVLFQHRHLPLNYVTLCRFVSLSSILLYCVVRDNTNTKSHIEDIKTCVQILEAFPSRWTHAKRVALVFRRLAVATNNTESAPSISVGYSPGSTISVSLSSLQELRIQVSNLVRDLLGESSIYNRAIDACAEILEATTTTNVNPTLQTDEFPDSIWIDHTILWSDVGDFTTGVL